MHASIIVGATQAAIYTHIDTSTLINSQNQDLIKKKRKLFQKGFSKSFSSPTQH